MDELIQPNWHIAMIHFPIALLVIGAGIEIFSFFGWRKSTFRIFARWAILLGAIIAVPTTFSGLYAMTDVVPGGLTALRQTDAAAADVLEKHLWLNVAATALAMTLVVFWIACSDVWRDRLSIFFKFALVAVVGLVLLGARYGGHTVYGYHIGPSDAPPSTLPSQLPEMPIDQLVDEALQAEQLHVVVAGFAAAVVCICLGWSMRAITQPDDPRAYEDAASTHRIAAAFSSGVPMMSPASNIDTAALLSQRPSESFNHTPPVRTGKFWFIALLLIVASAASGVLVLAVDQSTWNYDLLRNAITQPIELKDPKLTRRYAHTIVSLVLVGDTIILGIASIFARRKGWLLIALALPLIAALAAQVWLGILLLMDGPTGAVTRFNL